MLIQFSVKNYKSFAQRTTLSTAVRNRSGIEFLSTYYSDDQNIGPLQPINVINGSNEGRKDLYEALSALRNIVFGNLNHQTGEPFPVQAHKSMPEESPTEFHIHFLYGTIHYGYSVTLNQSVIFEESLYKHTSQKSARVFERYKNDDSGKIEVRTDPRWKKRFPESIERLNDRTLLLFMIFCIEPFQAVRNTMDWFRNELILFNEEFSALSREAKRYIKRNGGNQIADMLTTLSPRLVDILQADKPADENSTPQMKIATVSAMRLNVFLACLLEGRFSNRTVVFDGLISGCPTQSEAAFLKQLGLLAWKYETQIVCTTPKISMEEYDKLIPYQVWTITTESLNDSNNRPELQPLEQLA